MTERAKPFVAYLRARGGLWTSNRKEAEGWAEDCVTCVVTPLLADDPKPGDRMAWTDIGASRQAVTVVTAPFEDRQGRSVGIQYDGDAEVYFAQLAKLRRPPVLKTFRAPGASPSGWRYIKAESKDAALKILAEGLQEVPPGEVP